MATPRTSSEIAVAAWGALTFAALLASYAGFRPVRDALILDGDPDQIPWLFTATFAAVCVVSPAWSALLARFDRRRAVPLTFHVFAGCLVAFAWCVRAAIDPVTVGRVFYVWSAVFNLFVVSVFWSLLADLLAPEVARRLYGPIAAGGTIGAFVGPLLTKLLVSTIGVPGVLLVAVGMLELAVIGASQVRRAGEALGPRSAAAPATPGGAFTGLAHVARSRYLTAIVGYVLCTAIAATFLYLQQLSIVRSAFHDATARTEYNASIEMWTAAATFVVQTAIAGPLLRRVGPGVVMIALPLVQLAAIALLGASPSLTLVATVLVISKTATHGLTRPARELLFTVVSSDDKYRAKNVIDTIVYRFGDLGSSWLRTGLVATGAGSAAVLGASVPLVAIWIALATVLGVGFRRRAMPVTQEP